MKDIVSTIREIENYFENIPKDFKFYVGLDDRTWTRERIKVHFDIPKYWLVVDFNDKGTWEGKESAIEVKAYFIRKGFIDSDISDTRYRPIKLFLFAKP